MPSGSAEGRPGHTEDSSRRPDGGSSHCVVTHHWDISRRVTHRPASLPCLLHGPQNSLLCFRSGGTLKLLPAASGRRELPTSPPDLGLPLAAPNFSRIWSSRAHERPRAPSLAAGAICPSVALRERIGIRPESYGHRRGHPGSAHQACRHEARGAWASWADWAACAGDGIGQARIIRFLKAGFRGGQVPSRNKRSAVTGDSPVTAIQREGSPRDTQQLGGKGPAREAQWGARVWGEGLCDWFYKLFVTVLPNQSLWRTRPLRRR